MTFLLDEDNMAGLSIALGKAGGLEPIQITRSIPKGSPMPALSAKNVLNVEKTTPPSIFGACALASNFSLGLITTRLFG